MTKRTHAFREDIGENEIFRETIFAISYGAQKEFFYFKKSKISWHCPSKKSKQNSVKFMFNLFFFYIRLD